MAIQLQKNTRTTKSASSSEKTFASFFKRSQLTAKDRKFFTEQMALLLETGSNLQASLQALRNQVGKPEMQDMLAQLQQDVEQGRQFSAALSRYPQFFSSTYINLIAASEDAGYMHEVLEQLLEMEEKREQLHQTIVSALSYPVFLLVFALAVVVFVLVVVFPKFADLFSMIADQLPVTTVFLMATSEFIQRDWAYLLVGLVVLFGGLKIWSSSEHGRDTLDAAKLRLPLLRTIFSQLYLVQSLRVLSLSLGNGVNVMDALRTSRGVVNNRVFQRFLKKVEDEVEQGNGIAVGFRNERFIPPVVAQMITTGEESGQLPKVLTRLSSYYENELSNRLQTLSRMAEPLMLLIMGGVVGVIVSSLILPIFKLSHAVG
jgi:type II secretory pathway component PulF